MKTAIMTDSNSGMNKEEAASYDIFCMPMPVLIDGKSYYENQDLSVEEYLDSLLKGRDVTTSQPSPMDIIDEWNRILDLGYDEIVYIPMSSGLSSSCGSAMGFAGEFDGRVTVVDNKRISISQKTSVFDAKALADSGKSGSEIKELLEKTSMDYIIYLAVDTLKYFMKTGRASKAAATLVGDLLSVKPILKTTGEKFEPVTIARSQKKCEEKIIESLRLNLDTRFKGIDKELISVGCASSCREKKDAIKWFNTMKEAFPEYGVFYVPLSCSITTHTGPDARGAGIMHRLTASKDFL